MQRKIIVTIDTIMDMFKDYTAGTKDIPSDAVALSLQVNPAQKGKFRILAESESWTEGSPIVVDFQIKRVHAV